MASERPRRKELVSSAKRCCGAITSFPNVCKDSSLLGAREALRREPRKEVHAEWEGMWEG